MQSIPSSYDYARPLRDVTHSFNETITSTNKSIHPKAHPSSNATASCINTVYSTHVDQQRDMPRIDVDEATRQHYSQLVAYYWHYAQQGWLAPIIGGDASQTQARDEAAMWASRHGIQLFEPAQGGSRPLPQRPPLTSTSSALFSSPPPPTAPLSSNRHTLPAQPPQILNSVSESSLKRPLPQPPARQTTVPSISSNVMTTSTRASEVDDLQARFNDTTLVDSTEKQTYPTMVLSTEQDHETKVAVCSVPTFNFSIDGDQCNDNDDSSSSVPVLTLPKDDQDDTNDSNEQDSQPRLHPRFDPLHPSHFLYHPTSTSSTFEAGTIECQGCSKTMFGGRALMALGKTWHPSCFKCMEPECDQLLEHVQFDAKDDQVFCMVHFEERFVEQCYHCKTPIADGEFIKIQDSKLLPCYPTVRTYHALHFFCANCGDPFVDPTELAQIQQQQTKLLNHDQSQSKGQELSVSRPYIVNKGYAYCQECDIKLFRPKCFKCKQGLRDEWVEIDQGQKLFHPDCFHCQTCLKPLSDTYLVANEPISTVITDATRSGSIDNESNETIERMYCVACFDAKAQH
ncbi:hypothetical protein OIO90_004858 [Microbotryomycetes sp. JL221]|nr:hypothetical protein OIO90_004858 [Microbotryomycetes sp. JL221]